MGLLLKEINVSTQRSSEPPVIREEAVWGVCAPVSAVPHAVEEVRD